MGGLRSCANTRGPLILVACEKLSAHKFVVLVAGVVLVAVAAVLSLLPGPFAREWSMCACSVDCCPAGRGESLVRALYFAACFMYTAMAVMWVCYARTFAANLRAPLDIAPLCDDGEYRRLAYECLAFYRMPRERCGIADDEATDPRRRDADTIERDARVCHFVFWLMWTAYTALDMYTVTGLNLPLPATVFLELLLLVVMVLNGSSFSLCARYVWFLKEFSRSRCLHRFKYVLGNPSLSTAYQRLAAASRGNSLVFFISVLLFSLVMLAGIVIAAMGGYSPANWVGEHPSPHMVLVFCAMGAFAIGLVGFGVVYFCSKMFLSEVLDVWRTDAASMLERKYCVVLRTEVLPSCGSLDDERLKSISSTLREIYSKSAMRRADVATIIVAVASLLVNVAMLVFAVVSGGAAG